MHGGALTASLLFHAAIIAALSISLTFGSRTDFIELEQVIAVDLVSIGEETVMKPTPPEEPVEEAPPAPPVKAPPPAETEPEPEEVVTAQEEAKAAPPPVAEKQPEPEPAPPIEPQEPPKEPPKPEPEPIDESTAMDDFAKLIDRSKETPTSSEQAEEDFFAAFGKDRPRSTVADSREQSISLEDAARTLVQKCWAPPLGAQGAAQMRVSVSVSLGPDGAVIGTPKLDDADQRRMNRSNETVFRVFAESAVRAIRQCAPYQLPKARYNEWRSLRLNFDPSQMLN